MRNTTDAQVIAAFVQGHVATSKKLHSSGARLDGLWLGGGGIAAWDDGRVVIYDLGSKAAERVRKQLIRKLPRGLLHANSVWALPMRTIRAEGYGSAIPTRTAHRRNSTHSLPIAALRRNPRPAKTYEYLYVLQGYYAHGWEDLTAEKKQGAGVDLPAMRRLRTEKKNYQQNEGGQYRIIERREKIA